MMVSIIFLSYYQLIIAIILYTFKTLSKIDTKSENFKERFIKTNDKISNNSLTMVETIPISDSFIKYYLFMKISIVLF